MGGKNMQKRIVVVALVALLTLGVGQGVLAFGRGGGKGWPNLNARNTDSQWARAYTGATRTAI